MREIGGYIELDRHEGNVFHDEAIPLNSGRACLEYLIKAKNISKLYIPYFCCNSVAEPCVNQKIEYEYYNIDEKFRPVFNKTLGENEWLYIVNYYGQITNDEMLCYKEKYKRVIADYAQSYFQKPAKGTDTLYTCRKFFGVSDGGFLYTDKTIEIEKQDESFERIHYVLGRFEREASEFYLEAKENNEIFANEGVKKMSKLTLNILRSLDYEEICRKRTENFSYLNEKLGALNKLSVTNTVGSFMYPFYTLNGGKLREQLLSEKIYIPVLWPDVFDLCSNDSLEYDYAKNILPIPVDQRYNLETMNYLSDRIKSLL